MISFSLLYKACPCIFTQYFSPFLGNNFTTKGNPLRFSHILNCFHISFSPCKVGFYQSFLHQNSQSLRQTGICPFHFSLLIRNNNCIYIFSAINDSKYNCSSCSFLLCYIKMIPIEPIISPLIL
jgi:hypothetical protein